MIVLTVTKKVNDLLCQIYSLAKELLFNYNCCWTFDTCTINTFAIFRNRLSFQLCFLYTLTEIRFRRTRSMAIGLARRTITCEEEKHND